MKPPATDEEWDQALRLAQRGEPWLLCDLICAEEPLSIARRRAIATLLRLRLARPVDSKKPLIRDVVNEIRRTYAIWQAVRRGKAPREALGDIRSREDLFAHFEELYGVSPTTAEQVIYERGAYAPGRRLRGTRALLPARRGFPRWHWP